HVAETLQARWGVAPAAQRVVPNVLNAVFAQTAPVEPLALPETDVARFCFPTRLHPHKNVAVLGAAARLLQERHGLGVQFVLTLTEGEWGQLDDETRAASVNAGPLRISQVPSLYASCAGAV